MHLCEFEPFSGSDHYKSCHSVISLYITLLLLSFYSVTLASYIKSLC